MRLEYFQMIDRIVEFDLDGQRVKSMCAVPQQSTVFEGHFPSYPLMPGVLLIECMAQTTGWLVCMLRRFTAMPFLAGVKEGKFRNAVFPGDLLEFDGNVIHEGSGYAVAECVGRRAGAVVCNAKLTFRILPYPSPEFRQAFFETAERLNLPVRELVK